MSDGDAAAAAAIKRIESVLAEFSPTSPILDLWGRLTGAAAELFPSLAAADLLNIDRALEKSGQPEVFRLLVLVAAARHAGLASPTTAYAAEAFAALLRSLYMSPSERAMDVARAIVQMYDQLESDLDDRDDDRLADVLMATAKCLDLIDAGDGGGLKRAEELLLRVRGARRGEALTSRADVTLRLSRIADPDHWRDESFASADQAVSLLDQQANPDWYARALHQRGLARRARDGGDESTELSLRDLEAAYDVWREHGSPHDQLLNRLAAAHLHGYGQGENRTEMRTESLIAALQCYRQAAQIMTAGDAPAAPLVQHELQHFFQRMLGGPLHMGREFVLDIIWEHASDLMLDIKDFGAVEWDDLLSDSMWTPSRGIPESFAMPLDTVPGERDDCQRYLITRWEDAWASIARSLCEAGLQQLAGENLLAYLQTHPDDADVWYQLGALHLFQGQHQEAAACFERALQIRRPWPIVERTLAAIGA